MTNARPIVACLGGGQLARMMALEGARMGVDLRVLDPNPEACARTVCEHILAPFDDDAAIDRLIDGVDAVTYEFESVPASVCERLEAQTTLRPGARSLRVCQDRALEKELFERSGLDVHPWRRVENEAQLGAALGAVGLPCVLKRRTGGYDGRGQRVIRNEADAIGAWEELGRTPCIVEAFVAFRRELSLIGARTQTGDTAFYPVIENVHDDGTLSTSKAPAPSVSEETGHWAREHAHRLLGALDHVGVFTIEFFDDDGVLYANETAPRVHNTGHWTIEGAEISQFELHLRCVLGLPLGSTDAVGFCGMVNCIGAMPPLSSSTHLDGVRLHDYAKAARKGRKLGHLTCVRTSPGERDRALARMRIVAGVGSSGVGSRE